VKAERIEAEDGIISKEQRPLSICQMFKRKTILKEFLRGCATGCIASVFIGWIILLPFSALFGGFGKLYIISIPLCAVAFGFVYAAKARVSQLRSFRVSHHICAHCGYDLRACTTNMCPECGSYFQPKPPHLAKIIGVPESDSPDQSQFKDDAK
jgi:ribosomal protein L32